LKACIYAVAFFYLVMVKEAKYEVVKKQGKVEIRLYSKSVIARVEGEDNGFNILFSFISGNNEQKSKVRMTAPVISQSIEMTAPVFSDADSIAFVMPEGYTLETTPVPFDKLVEIVEVPERHVATIQFSGRWSGSIFNKRAKELLEELAKMKIKPKGSAFSMLYNSPFTPWFMRRNEVAVEVDFTA